MASGASTSSREPHDQHWLFHLEGAHRPASPWLARGSPSARSVVAWPQGCPSARRAIPRPGLQYLVFKGAPRLQASPVSTWRKPLDQASNASTSRETFGQASTASAQVRPSDRPAVGPRLYIAAKAESKGLVYLIFEGAPQPGE